MDGDIMNSTPNRGANIIGDMVKLILKQDVLDGNVGAPASSLPAAHIPLKMFGFKFAARPMQRVNCDAGGVAKSSKAVITLTIVYHSVEVGTMMQRISVSRM